MTVTINHKEIKHQNFIDICPGAIFLSEPNATPYVKIESVVDDYDCVICNAVNLLYGTVENFDVYDIVTIPESEELVINY